MTKKRAQPRPGVDTLGRTPLHYAAADGDEAACRQLLADGAIADAQDDQGWTPLHFAAQSGSVGAAAALLDAGASVTLVDRDGNSALFRAVFCSRGEGGVIALLRGAGADARAPNAHGVSPVGLARMIGNYDVARFFADLPADAG